MVNIVCIKWGDKYAPDYVNKLAAMVRRHLSRPHRFVCLTEDSRGIDGSIECLPLPDQDIPGLTGWWHKLSLFRPTLHDLTGPTLFLDLDLVITQDLGPFLDLPGEFCIIRDWAYRSKKVWNSSVFRLVIGEQAHVYQAFLDQGPDTVMTTRHGDQNFISEMTPDAVTWPAAWCQSFKYHCCVPKDAVPALPPDARMVIFHGKPDPHEAVIGTHRRYKAAPWIADHWHDRDLAESGYAAFGQEPPQRPSRTGRDARRLRIRLTRELAVVQDMLTRLAPDAGDRPYYESRRVSLLDALTWL
jgi:hypothetical protein